jgi:hypothetical protein
VPGPPGSPEREALWRSRNGIRATPRPASRDRIRQLARPRGFGNAQMMLQEMLPHAPAARAGSPASARRVNMDRLNALSRPVVRVRPIDAVRCASVPTAVACT